MADWSQPTLSSTYADFLSLMQARDNDALTQMQGAAGTNLPDQAIRWNPATYRWESWSATAGTWSAWTVNLAVTTVTLGQDPTSALQAATKRYVDTSIANAASPVPVPSSTNAGSFIQINAGGTAYVVLTASQLLSTIGAQPAGNYQAAGSYAASGVNSDITSLTGLTTALSIAQGGTGATTAAAARAALGALGTGDTAYNASHLQTSAGTSTWNWAGQGGQPPWLWGSSDGITMQVWNPSNFSVNYANSAGTANYANSAGSVSNIPNSSLGVGTYAWLYYNASSFGLNPGQQVNGSTLQTMGSGGATSYNVSGTWQSMGGLPPGNASQGGLFIRIA